MSFWKKLFGGGSKTSVAPVTPQPSSSPSKAQICQHNWNGCKCSLCGEIRNEGHDMSFSSFTDGSFEKCSICGKKGRSIKVKNYG
jgi:hypothetical protein